MSLAHNISCCGLRFVPPPPKPTRVSCLHSSTTTLSNIHNSGVIACLRAKSADVALEAARAAITGGISVPRTTPIKSIGMPCLTCDYKFPPQRHPRIQLYSARPLEIVVSTPGVFEVLHQLVQDFPTTTLGVGTVLNPGDAQKAKNAGAKFIMSPAIVKEILDQDSEDLLYIPGVMTPTEMLSSYTAGAKIVKVYPVSAVGGVQYIATLKKPFPHIPLVASQGITIGLVGEYIAHGASSVVLSDAIFDKKAMAQRNFSAVHRLARLAASKGCEAVERTRSNKPG